MAVNPDAYRAIQNELDEKKAVLVAVSKTKPTADIKALYDFGQRDFGENYVQELLAKQPQLPADIRWHFIGHLQSNKVKYIAPFVSLIQSVDSLHLLQEINRQAAKNNRVIDCLLQVHIAQEESKFGFDENELATALQPASVAQFPHARIIGLMGMASFSNDQDLVRDEFRRLNVLYRQYAALHPSFTTLSMGMSGDYQTALAEGSTMVRIGSLLFGRRR